MKADELGNNDDLNLAVEAAPQLAFGSCVSYQSPISDEHRNHIRNVLSEALDLGDSEKAQEIADSRNHAEYDVGNEKKSFLRSLAGHVKKNGRLGIEFVRDSAGKPIFNKIESCKHIGKELGERFAEKTIDESLARNLLAKHAKQFPDTAWIIPFFVSALSSGRARLRHLGLTGSRMRHGEYPCRSWRL